MPTSATEQASEQVDRFERVDKFEARRAELAEAALQTLGEVGVARASLREIAKETSFSHGVFHYYFRDKVDLVTYCVRRYKAVCVTRYDDVVEHSRSAVELSTGFADALVQTMHDDSAMHRLWYDLRSHAQFESALRPTVTELDASLEAMIWRVVLAYADHVGSPPRTSPLVAYGAFDGLFENCLMRHCGGDEGATEELRAGARWLLATTA